jgi:hypothetical protein
MAETAAVDDRDGDGWNDIDGSRKHNIDSSGR